MEYKDFHEILRKYRCGQASEEERKIVDAWYEAMGKQPDVMLSDEEQGKLEDRYWAPIADHLGKNRSHRTVLGWSVLGVAASILIVVSFIYLTDTKIIPGKASVSVQDEVSGNWTVIANDESIARRFVLPDSSSVTLEPKSMIKLSPEFNRSQRDVKLVGKAFFEVAHNEQRPFIVYANEVITKVLGTSFVVGAFEQDKNVTVAVKSGKVSVYTVSKNNPGKKDAIILTPNQSIVYDKNQDKISRSLIESPQPILPMDEVRRMRFKAAPVKDIFEAIEKIYGVDIEFDEGKFALCTLTTSVSDGDLYNRLDIVTNAIGAEYELNENKVVIRGPGCD